MTAQIADTVTLDGVSYDIIGVDAPGLPRPEDFSLQPRSIHTGCWRGFFLDFVCAKGRLHLNRLSIGEGDGVRPRVASARSARSRGDGHWHYQFPNHPVAYSGRLLLGAEFIQERYVHMGIQSADAFLKVLEVTFREGRVDAQVDLSCEAAALREEPGAKNIESVAPRLAAWLSAPFSLGPARRTETLPPQEVS
jgi:hypothetical protein